MDLGFLHGIGKRDDLMIKRTIMNLTLVAIAMVLVSASAVQAQRGGGRGFGGFGGFGGMGGGGPVGLASRDDVRKELGLTEKQISEIDEIAEGSRESRRDMFRGLQDLRNASQEEREQAVARMREQTTKTQNDERAKVNKVLTSDQRSRFAQLEFQFSLQRGSVQGALDAAGIEMSDSDRQKLSETREAVQQRVEEEVAKIRRDAQNEILASVVSEKQIEKMTGEPFEFAVEQRRFGGRQGGGGAAGGGREERARRRPATEDNDSGADEDSGTRRRRRR